MGRFVDLVYYDSDGAPERVNGILTNTLSSQFLVGVVHVSYGNVAFGRWQWCVKCGGGFLGRAHSGRNLVL